MYTVQKFIQMSLVSLVMHSGTVVSRLYSRGWWGWMVRIFVGGDNIFWTADQGSGQDIFCRWPVTKENFHHLGGGPGIFFASHLTNFFPKRAQKHLLSCFRGFSPLQNCVTSQINFQGCRGGTFRFTPPRP